MIKFYKLETRYDRCDGSDYQVIVDEDREEIDLDDLAYKHRNDTIEICVTISDNTSDGSR